MHQFLFCPRHNNGGVLSFCVFITFKIRSVLRRWQNNFDPPLKVSIPLIEAIQSSWRIVRKHGALIGQTSNTDRSACVVWSGHLLQNICVSTKRLPACPYWQPKAMYFEQPASDRWWHCQHDVTKSECEYVMNLHVRVLWSGVLYQLSTIICFRTDNGVWGWYVGNYRTWRYPRLR